MSTKRLSIFASRKKREEQKQHEAEEELRQVCSEEPPQLAKIKPIVQQFPSTLKAKDEDGELPLHLACWKGASLDVVQCLVQGWPFGVRAKTNRLWLPLHYACFGKETLDVIQYLVQQWQESIKAQDNRNRLPLHLACFSGAPLETIQYLVEQWPAGVQAQDNGGSLPLHLACDNKAPLQVVQWLVVQWPDSIKTENNYASLPLHRACFSLAPADVVQYLVQEHPEAVHCKTKDGDLPLHLCAGSGASLQVVQCVAQAWPDSVHAKNNEGKTPLDMAKQPFTFYKPTPQVVSWLEMVSSDQLQVGQSTAAEAAAAVTSSTVTVPSGTNASLPPSSSIKGAQALTPPKETSRPSDNGKHHHHHHSKPKPFEKERAKLLDVIHGKRDKPVSVPTKYPESILTSTVLGRGFFGVVYVGADREIHQKFAIKGIDREVLANGNKQVVEKMKNDFRNEQRALLYFRHPNTALLYAYSLSESSRKGHYLLYELAEKGSLDYFWSDELGRERLSYFSRRAQIALDTFIGLRFLHVGNKYVKPGFHRDIKSANIVLKRDMTAQLIDCGLATFVQNPTSSTLISVGVGGTRGYVCPKYCTGAIPYEAACDIFSFGVVLAELWSGSLQNHRDASGRFYNFYEEYIDEDEDPRNMEDDLDKSLGFGENEELPDYMYDYKDLALDCMARNPEKRPTGEEVMNRLERIWQECKQDVDDENSVYEDDRTIVDEDTFNESLQTVSNFHGVDESACQLCRTYAKEVGFDECPLCLALNQQRLRIAAAVSSKLDAKSTAPDSRDVYAMENRSLHNLRGMGNDMSLPVLSRLDIRLNNSIPRLFIIVPADLKDGWKPPRTWLRRKVATKYNLYFICGHTYQAMKPPIKLVASKAWMDKIALSLGVSLTLLQVAARKGFDIKMQLGGSGSTALHVGPDELSEMLTEVKHILDEGDNFDALGRIRSGNRFSEKDIYVLNGTTYELIVERAREERGWRTVMAPVRKRGDSSILWVNDAAAEDSRNDYEVIVV